MARQLQTFSIPPEMLARLQEEREETGIPLSRIIQQSLKARWAAQDAQKTK
jgi:hypothetical protein